MSTEPVRWNVATIPVSAQLMTGADSFRAALDAEMESIMRGIAAMAKLTPDEIAARLAQWDAERPQRVRRNILTNVATAMPGRRHGTFVRKAGV